MTSKPSKNVSRLRRHARVRKKVSGTAETPRLCLYRSNKNIEAQIIGRFDTVAAQNSEDDFKPLFTQADKNLTLILDQLTYVSSSGLRVFLNLRKEVIAKGGNLVLKNLTDEVHSVFTMTGFIKIFTIQ